MMHSYTLCTYLLLEQTVNFNGLGAAAFSDNLHQLTAILLSNNDMSEK